MKSLLCICFLCTFPVTFLMAQEHLIVFSKEGRIIKNDGYDLANSAVQARFIIEEVDQSEADNYFILHQSRNDYLYQTNNTLEQHQVLDFRYQPGVYAESRGVLTLPARLNDAELISYYLIKVDDTLASWIRANRTVPLNPLTLLAATEETFASQNPDLGKAEELIKTLEEANKAWQKLKTEKQKGDFADYKKLLEEKTWLEKQLTLVKEQRSLLPEQKEGCCTTSMFTELGEQIESLTWKILEKEKDLKKAISLQDEKIKEQEETVSSAKKELKASLGKIVFPSLKVLHQGTLVAKIGGVHEIVYDVYAKKIGQSDKKRTLVGRWTPDLPQLNTESQLYLHLLNIQPDIVASDPFTFRLTDRVSEEVTIESPSNFQGLQDAAIDFPNLSGRFPKSSRSNWPGEPEDSLTKNTALLKKVYDQFKTIDLEANYLDYVLKYPTKFKANREVTLELKRKQYVSEDFAQPVEESQLKKENYVIKYQEETLTTDVLPAVHRLFRFALNTGVALRVQQQYFYNTEPIGGTSQLRLVEDVNVQQSLRPLLTFSTYLFGKQDIAIDPQGFAGIRNTLHFDVGIDYAQKDVFDDLYLGLGVEPWRAIHFSAGAVLSQVARVDANRLDPLTLNVQEALVDRTQVGFYIGVNLGVNFVPTIIDVFTK